jgi:hypothetical protein
MPAEEKASVFAELRGDIDNLEHELNEKRAEYLAARVCPQPEQQTRLQRKVLA